MSSPWPLVLRSSCVGYCSWVNALPYLAFNEAYFWFSCEISRSHRSKFDCTCDRKVAVLDRSTFVPNTALAACNTCGSIESLSSWSSVSCSASSSSDRRSESDLGSCRNSSVELNSRSASSHFSLSARRTLATSSEYMLESSCTFKGTIFSKASLPTISVIFWSAMVIGLALSIGFISAKAAALGTISW
ncbi:hypothetical protein OGAPHI_000724 [Ogataea philodendri]|uniref:Uncharacterized protein n=1 Tax=Ogataea philodendri TaxID=1378263 RepID=A0A9P8T964_9ASCO|nr:uncharacterized protein OGAPHI_000724 [Ogataea philodendri]KAH3671013.1 hypothetical protein OGAPHI_000724 [Ogataea philodendri]